MNQARLRQLGIATVIVHLLVVTPHSIAHTSLQIEMNFWQNIYIGLVILLGPIVSAVLLGMRERWVSSCSQSPWPDHLCSDSTITSSQPGKIM